MVESLGLSQSALMCSKSLPSLVLSEILRTLMTPEHISTGPGQVTQEIALLEEAPIIFYPSLLEKVPSEQTQMPRVS